MSELHTSVSTQRKGKSAWRIGLPAGVLACTAALAAPMSAGAAERIVGVDGSNNLVSFTSQGPAGATSRAVTGLVAGDSLVGIDRRPLTGQLYVVSAQGRIYIVDPGSARATAVTQTPFSPLPVGSSFGVDFNPMVDRIRFVSNATQDLRLNQIDGTTAAVDGPLAYAPGDPNGGRTPTVEAVAYDTNVANAPMTELYDIDTTQDALSEQDPPNAGVLNTKGPLGVNAIGPVGYDIAGTNGIGYASFRRSGQSVHELFNVNEDTGRATPAARFNFLPIRGGLRGLTAVGQVPDDRSRPRTAVSIRGVQSRSRVRSRGLQVSGTCNEACVFDVTVRLGRRTVGRTQGVASRSGFRVPLTSSGRSQLRRGTRTLSLSVRTYDAAGNRGTSVRRNVVVR